MGQENSSVNALGRSRENDLIPYNRPAGSSAKALDSRSVPNEQSFGDLDRARKILLACEHPSAGEALVDVRSLGIAGDNYYARSDGSNPPYGYRLPGAVPVLCLRKEVARRLVLVDQALKPAGLRLYVYDAWRPLAVQQALWDFHSRRIRESEPGLSPDERNSIVARYVGDPRKFDAGKPSTWPLHITGGAVDLTLFDREADLPVDMGTGFDAAVRTSATAALEENRGGGSENAKLARRVLYHAMTGAGFTNYPYEWWHYDFGTQLHALMLQGRSGGKRYCGRYGPVTAPVNDMFTS